ncbi:MAG: hypothetical protein ACLT8E_06005 [Akkermansia sp.]
MRIIPGDTFLGGKRSIPLDKNGRIPLAANSSPTILDTKEVIVPVMSGLRPPDTTAVRKLLSSADAVLVSEPSALSDTPDAQSLLAAQTVRSIMGALAPAPAVLIPIAPAWVQWIIVLDVLLLQYGPSVSSAGAFHHLGALHPGGPGHRVVPVFRP